MMNLNPFEGEVLNRFLLYVWLGGVTLSCQMDLGYQLFAHSSLPFSAVFQCCTGHEAFAVKYKIFCCMLVMHKCYSMC